MYLIIHNVHIAAILDLFKTHISWRFCLKLVGKKNFVILSVSGSVLQHLNKLAADSTKMSHYTCHY